MIRTIAAILLAITLALPAYAEPQYVERRLVFTHYLPTGQRTYSGEWPSTDTGACSWDLPLGAVIVLEYGHVYRCNDRGMLGSRGHLDAFVLTREQGQALAALYGDSVMARIFLPEGN